MKLRVAFVVVLLCAISPLIVSASDPRAHPVIQLFLQLCVATQSTAYGMEGETGKLGFRQLPDSEAAKKA